MKKIIILLIIAAFFTSCSAGKEQGEMNETDNEVNAEENADNADNSDNAAEQEIPPVSEDVVTDADFDQLAMPDKGETIAILKTDKGDIKVRFFNEDAPKAVENFISLSDKDYYDSLEFCRTVENFVIQAGSPTNDSMGGESTFGAPFEDEFSTRLHNYRGALSMANSGANTNGSQFFIVQAGPVGDAMANDLKTISEYKEAMYQDYNTGQVVSGAQRFTAKAVEIYADEGGTPHLDGGFPIDPSQRSWHTVFGQVFEGMDIVDEIAKGETDEQDKPINPVKINDIEITEY